jgi:hypothetical protein
MLGLHVGDGAVLFGILSGVLHIGNGRGSSYNANGPKVEDKDITSLPMGCVGICQNRSATLGRSLVASTRGVLLCPNDVSPATGVRLRSMTSWNAAPPAINCTSGDVGTPRRDGAASWGSGLCVKDRADDAGRQPPTVDDTELAVEPKWLVVN